MKPTLPQKRRLNEEDFEEQSLETPPVRHPLEKNLKRQRVQNESPSSLGKDSTEECEHLPDSIDRNKRTATSSQEIMQLLPPGELRILKSVREVIQSGKNFPQQLYQKAQHIQIGQLSTLKDTKPHVSKDKLSEKFTRRDIALFQQYSTQGIEQMSDEYPKEINYEQIYGDIEHVNFLQLTQEPDYIQNAFGKSIQVKLRKIAGNKVRREILEDKRKVAKYGSHENKAGEKLVGDEDPDIHRIKCQMKSLVEDFKVTEEMVCELWCQCSGSINEIRKLLQGKKVVTWNYLEDLALEKAEESEEFQVLLRTKGRAAIDERKKFLMFEEEKEEEGEN